MHTPVLLHEVLEALDPIPGDVVIDGTVDGGGHAAAIVSKIMPKGEFLGVDLDDHMIALATEKILATLSASSLGERIAIVSGNYADLPQIVAERKFPKANELLVDLGFSSEQLESSGRGFSFSEATRNEPLLMTYEDSRTPVRELLTGMSEAEIAKAIFDLGGERYARRIAKAIKERERRHRIMTSGELADVVRGAVPHRGKIDPATRTFQALRILANGELENLERLLGHLGDIIAPGGRVAIISFHSLEDGIVKRAFRKMAADGVAEILTKKPIAATREEVLQNPRSRSAKLRAIKITK